MYRYLEEQIKAWVQRSNRSPLLIRGARQVGKTYLVEQIASHYFKNSVTINFEFQVDYIECFETLDPVEIIKRIQVQTGQSINEDTLIFLDEIQECPNAILAMRYFKEKLPNQAIIGAGSLLEFVLESEQFRMPVGRIEFLFLQPLSFKEFLLAMDEKPLVDWITEFDGHEKTPSSIHKKALKLVREYCYVGGMPEVVKQYVSNPTDIMALQNQQSKLIQGYRLDFGKYAKTEVVYKYLQTVFEQLSDFVAKQVSYAKICQDAPSRDIKKALNLVRLAGLCHYINSSTGAGIPLKANVNYKKFKLLYLDIGLYLRDLKLDLNLLNAEDITLINAGALAEQFVGQQLINLSPVMEPAELFFWARDKRGSQAEVDYLWQFHDAIIPIEVKSGSTGRLKSLKIFMETYKSKIGLRISSEPYQVHDHITSVPFYLLSEIDRLMRLK